jgi:hypothetical protein
MEVGAWSLPQDLVARASARLERQEQCWWNRVAFSAERRVRNNSMEAKNAGYSMASRGASGCGYSADAYPCNLT